MSILLLESSDSCQIMHDNLRRLFDSEMTIKQTKELKLIIKTSYINIPDIIVLIFHGYGPIILVRDLLNVAGPSLGFMFAKKFSPALL